MIRPISCIKDECMSDQSDILLSSLSHSISTFCIPNLITTPDLHQGTLLHYSKTFNMKSSFASIFLAFSAAAISATASPTPLETQVEPLERRQGFIEGIIISAIIGASSGALKGIIGGEQP